MRFYWLALGILCTWRLTHLLAFENGPFDFIVRLRRATSSSVWGRMLDCFNCLSLWVAAPIAIAVGGRWLESLLCWLAYSGGAILLDRIARERAMPPVQYVEDHQWEANHELLRTRQATDADRHEPPDPA